MTGPRFDNNGMGVPPGPPAAKGPGEIQMSPEELQRIYEGIANSSYGMVLGAGFVRIMCQRKLELQPTIIDIPVDKFVRIAGHVLVHPKTRITHG